MVKAFFIIPFLSLHTQAYNANTPGIGVEAQSGCASYATAIFIDSENHMSSYAGTGVFAGKDFRIGVFGGVMTRKGLGAFPFVLPVVGTEYLNVAYVPPIPVRGFDIPTALHFQFRIPFE